MVDGFFGVGKNTPKNRSILSLNSEKQVVIWEICCFVKGFAIEIPISGFSTSLFALTRNIFKITPVNNGVEK